MNHKKMALQLSAYVDGELAAHEAEEIREHLAECANCRAVVEDYQKLRSEVLAIADVEPAGNFASKVARAARLQLETQTAWSGIEIFARRLVIGLTLVVFFVVSVGSLNVSEQTVVIEPGLSGVAVDSTVQKTLLHGEVSREDMILAVLER